MRTTFAIPILALVAAVSAGCASAELPGADDDRLTEARELCAPRSEHVRVADGGRTLLVDARGLDEPSGARMTQVSCLLQQLGAPVAVQQHINQTSVMDGRQRDTWPGYEAAWTFHPSKGLDLMIELAAPPS